MTHHQPRHAHAHTNTHLPVALQEGHLLIECILLGAQRCQRGSTLGQRGSSRRGGGRAAAKPVQQHSAATEQH